eukprot:1138453-Pelagomonas_calceolata.AAC.2
MSWGCFSSVGIECCSPRKGPFSLGWHVPILVGQCGFGWKRPREGVVNLFTLILVLQLVLRAGSPMSSDAKLAGREQKLLCMPSALALWNAL